MVRQAHPVLDLANTGVAPLVLRNALLFAEPAAVLGRREPGHAEDRSIRARAVLLRQPPLVPDAGARPQELPELPDRHLLGSEGEGARDDPGVQHFLGAPPRL